MATLRKQDIKDTSLFDSLFSKDWVVYAKKPFGSASSVVEYLGRYTHKVAISNHRIVRVAESQVSFKTKNYKKDGKQEILTLEANEFIRRFAMHILPKGFVRIRHYGFLSSTGKAKYLCSLKDQLGKVMLKKKKESLHLVCPSCKKGRLVTLCTFDNRGPPKRWIEQLAKQNNVQKTKQA
nr:transposase [uncultured Dokdonia sp.]